MSAPRVSWGITSFCDDIRFEIGGKITLVGIYQSDLLLPANTILPAHLPKLALMVRYNELKGSMTEDIDFKVFFPGSADPILTMKAERSSILQTPVIDPPDDDSEQLYNISFPLILGPLPIVCEGPIKVRAYCGGVVTRLGRLVVKKLTEEQQATFFANASLPQSVPPPPDVPAS